MTQRSIAFGTAGLGAGLAMLLAIWQGGLGIAAAQSGVGTVTGRVVWCGTAVYPLTITPNGPVPQSAEPGINQPAPGPDVQPAPPTAPDASPGGQPVPQIRPVPRAIPAGAVLVAAQNTSLSTRTDENGQFSLGGVPTGQFLTVAAGPVSSAANASAARVNVSVAAGQTVDLGTLSLTPPSGAGCVFGGGPLPMVPGAGASGAVTGTATAPGADTSQP